MARAHFLSEVFPSDLVARAEAAFWGAFLFAASGGFAFALGSGTGEKLFWLMADGLAVVFLGLSLDRYARLLTENGALVAWAALAMLSALWSLEPGLSLYHGLQLFLTVLVGLVIRERYGLEGLVRLLFWALAVAVALSLLIGGAGGGINAHGEWRGVFSHKNVLGAASTTLFFLGLTRFTAGVGRASAAAAMAAASLTLALSGSASAMVVFAALGTAKPFLLAYRKGAGPALTAAALAVAGAAAVGLAVTLAGIDPVAAALDALGKDRTLTGRTLLWNFARDAFAERPVLGYGYKAWWESGATAAAYLRYAIGQDLWFFHNNALEVAVALGSVGLAAFALGIVIHGGATVLRYLRAPTPWGGWAILFLINALILAAVENPLFVNHGLYQLLFAAALARGRSLET